MMLFYLAIRNLFLQRERYTLMALAVAIGFVLITVLTGISYGALETIKTKAALYFSGNISVIGVINNDIGELAQAEEVVKNIMKQDIPIKTVSKRTVYYGTTTRLFFGGNFIELMRPIGIDFEAEKEEISHLPFVSGGIDGMLGENGKNGIIISTVVARILGARLGDDIVLYLVTKSGQYNTGNMIVKGIFDETSIFGYSAYLRREDLNKFMQKPPEFASEVAVFTKEGVNYFNLSKKIRLALSEEFLVFRFLETRNDYVAVVDDETWETDVETLAVISVDSQLSQIKNLLDAFLAGTYFILVIFLLIVMGGILNTYKVLVYERISEIGTMRAIGMQTRDVKKLFLYEAAALSVIASAVGFIVGLVTLKLIGLFNFGSITVARMFTEGGYLQFYVDIPLVLLNFCFMIAAVVLAAYGPARKAALMPPVEALQNK